MHIGLLSAFVPDQSPDYSSTGPTPGSPQWKSRLFCRLRLHFANRIYNRRIYNRHIYNRHIYNLNEASVHCTWELTKMMQQAFRRSLKGYIMLLFFGKLFALHPHPPPSINTHSRSFSDYPPVWFFLQVDVLNHECSAISVEASQVSVAHIPASPPPPPPPHIYLSVCYAELLSHSCGRITNPVCRRWCGSGTSGTKQLCWELFAFAWVFLALASLHAPHTSFYPPPLSLFHTPSLSLAGPYAQNLRLISSSACQSALCIYHSYCVLLACMRSDSVGDSEGLWHWRPEVEGWGWRTCSVTPSPLLVIAVEWPDQTARWAPRPSTVSDCTEVWREVAALLLVCFQDVAFTCLHL